ncbi:MAG: superoxide dismutase [Patescibacteria group bacterium]
MFTLPLLPYDQAALEPYISVRTLDFHYGKHHQAYIDNLNKLVAGTELEKETLESIIKKTASDPAQTAIFNNAAQACNHAFFWNSLRPAEAPAEDSQLKAAPAITPELSTLIDSTFGSLDNFYAEFKAAAVSQFGSGWVWLVKDGKTLKIIKTANADNPWVRGLKPLLTIDVWEHAYYLDYQNRRADFVEAILRHLLNWPFAEINFR